MKVYRFIALFFLFGIVCRTETIFCKITNQEEVRGFFWVFLLLFAIGVFGIFREKE